MQKAYRFLVERFNAYAEEGGAYLRRRRMRSRPFVRVHLGDGTILTPDPASPLGARLNSSATSLLAAHEPDEPEDPGAPGEARPAS